MNRDEPDPSFLQTEEEWLEARLLASLLDRLVNPSRERGTRLCLGCEECRFWKAPHVLPD